jgi:Cu+-exporting ATPase
MEEATSDVRLTVEGMMCQRNCGSTVTRALESVPGVSHVIVSFEKKQALCWGSATVEELIDAIECVGFEAELQTNGEEGNRNIEPDTVLLIQGMTCPKTGPQQVSDLLLSCEGILEVRVDYEMGLAALYGFVEAQSAIDLLSLNNFYTKEVQPGTAHWNEALHITNANARKNDGNSSTLSTTPATEANPYLITSDAADEDFFGAEGVHSAELHVTGMSCASCAKSVTNALSRVRGVKTINVALLIEKVLIILYSHYLSFCLCFIKRINLIQTDSV